MICDHVFQNDPEFRRYLAHLPDDLLQCATVVEYPANTTLFHKFDPMDHIFILIHGEVQVVREYSNGNYYSFAKLERFDFLGDLAILSGHMVSAVTSITISNTKLVCIPTSDFLKAIEKDITLLMLCVRNLAGKMFQTSINSGRYIYINGLDKLKRYLVAYYERYSTTKNVAMKIDKTYQQMATEIGISVKTVSRSIRTLKENGLISIRKGKIVLSSEQYALLGAELRTLTMESF